MLRASFFTTPGRPGEGAAWEGRPFFLSCHRQSCTPAEHRATELICMMEAMYGHPEGPTVSGASPSQGAHLGPIRMRLRSLNLFMPRTATLGRHCAVDCQQWYSIRSSRKVALHCLW